MGKQIMLINVHEDETRIASIEDNILVGLHIQQTSRERKVGNIYRGKIVKINPAFQAAFIDYGEPRNGFLSISDVNFNLHKPKEGDLSRPKIQSVLREGQPVMVQIIKEGMSNKGSAMTTFVSLAGRYMVITPHSDRSGVSRKIEDQESRTRLKDIMVALSANDNLGTIIRTAGIDRPMAELKKDLDSLRKEWKSIQSKYEKAKRPAQIHQEPSPIVRVLRDYFTSEIQEVWVDDANGFQEALAYFKSTLPRYQKRLKLYVGDRSLFSAHHIEDQIEALDSSRVSLPSGGSLVIESTEALVSVDVNSGRSNQESDIEETALRTNLEAANEVARQLRLRNLGGLIVVDFIDMFQSKNRRIVETSMSDALKGDKARTTIGAISQFGLLELSRQRIDMELSHGLRIQCPHCGGTGHIPTVNTSANNLLRNVREMAAKGKYKEIHGELPLENANFILNDKREALRDLELEFDVVVKLSVNPDLSPGYPITLHGKGGGASEEDASEEISRAPSETHRSDAPADASSSQRRRRRKRGPREEEFPSESGMEAGGMDREEDPQPAATASSQPVSPGGQEGYSPVAGTGKAASAARHKEKEAGQASRAKHGDAGRRGKQPGGGQPADNGSSAQKGYRSEHIITNPEALDKLPPRMVRSKPFASVSGQSSADTVLYDSNRALGSPPIATSGDKKAERRPAEKSSGRRRRAPKKSAAASSSDSTVNAHGDSQPAGADSDSGEPVAEKSAPAKKSRGRGRSSTGRKSAKSPAVDSAAVDSAAVDSAAGNSAAATSGDSTEGSAPKPGGKSGSSGKGRGRGRSPRGKPDSAASTAP